MASTSANEKRTMILKSSDGEEFEVEVAVAMLSQTIKHLMDDGCVDDGVPLPNVRGDILAKVVDYCEKHVQAEDGSDEIEAWDADFVKVEQSTLFEIILAANYLAVAGLLDLACQTVADMIKGRTPEEIREHFDIENDFSPEEEEEMRRETRWSFE